MVVGQAEGMPTNVCQSSLLKALLMSLSAPLPHVHCKLFEYQIVVRRIDWTVVEAKRLFQARAVCREIAIWVNRVRDEATTRLKIAANQFAHSMKSFLTRSIVEQVHRGDDIGGMFEPKSLIACIDNFIRKGRVHQTTSVILVLCNGTLDHFFRNVYGKHRSSALCHKLSGHPAITTGKFQYTQAPNRSQNS